MTKDFTDYILFICDAGERVYHLEHLRSFNGKNAKGLEYGKVPYVHNTHKYQLNLDRAYRIRWAPWKKIMRRSPRRLLIKTEWYFGLPDKKRFEKKEVRIVKAKQRLFSVKLYATLKEFIRAKRIGIIFYQEPCTQKCSTCPHNKMEVCPIPLLVEPMHISRIHQPSGEMRG